VEDIHHFKNINALMLKNNEIDDIEALAEFTELTATALLDNNIRDISPLANLTKIDVLALCENNIRDVSVSAFEEKIVSTISNKDSNDDSEITTIVNEKKQNKILLKNSNLLVRK